MGKRVKRVNRGKRVKRIKKEKRVKTVKRAKRVIRVIKVEKKGVLDYPLSVISFFLLKCKAKKECPSNRVAQGLGGN